VTVSRCLVGMVPDRPGGGGCDLVLRWWSRGPGGGVQRVGRVKLIGGCRARRGAYGMMLVQLAWGGEEDSFCGEKV